MPNWKMPDKTDKQGYWLKKLCCNHVQEHTLIISLMEKDPYQIG